MLAQLGLSEDQLAKVKRSARYAKEEERLYYGVPELLVSLSARFDLGVIANQSRGTEDRLARWGIRDHFSLVFASAELGLSKPDPVIFAGARSKAKVEPEDMVMVGDRIDNDIGPAKAHGWKTIRVLQGFSRFQEPRGPEEDPDMTVGKIEELSANQRLEDIAANRAESSA